jgi:hypothetical protein
MGAPALTNAGDFGFALHFLLFFPIVGGTWAGRETSDRVVLRGLRDSKKKSTEFEKLHQLVKISLSRENHGLK